ncbi:uncharacterized protein LOC110311738 [Mus caroli]|uniref:Uncharacterized protein LOC110311738 n=1 Tax=Mus caroli TaxID=10089 RepID=A0A6P5R7Q0_MUSCR|nr:uncharacterized protein LOC110311738 [Mus caroli]
MLPQAETSTSVWFRKRKKPNTPDGGEAGQHRASCRGGVQGTGTGVLAVIPGSSKGGSSRGGARVRAAQPGLAEGARVPVPVGTVAWDELPSACARAEIRTRGRGEQLQPNPGQKHGNPASANLPAMTRSTRSRHNPQLPARCRPRLRLRLLGAEFRGVPPPRGRGCHKTVSEWKGPGHPSSLWAALFEHLGFR